MTERPVLYIGNKRYSSWSLRPWLALSKSGLEFDTVVIPLDTREFVEQVARVSPMPTVPVLHVDGLVVWDSLAICEWVAERAPSLWPADPRLRAVGRSLASSMHAGFISLRGEAPMNLGRERPKQLSEAALRDVRLVEALWRKYRVKAGPYFFGDWSLVDAFWTPVATRIQSYAISVEPDARIYVDTLLADPHFQTWRADALAETYPPPPYELA